MVAHALAFPEIWYGIWSGPDGLNSTFGDNPGQTWMSEYTPMTDFPIMNNNGPAMTILAALRSGGAPPAPGLTCHLPSGVGPVAIKTAVLSCRTP